MIVLLLVTDGEEREINGPAPQPYHAEDVQGGGM